MACQELTQNGLMYKDEETGEDKIIPRFVDDSGYEYTEKEQETKDLLVKQKAIQMNLNFLLV